MAVICAYAKYEDSSGDGVDGLTVTWDVDRVVRATGVRDALVTAGANNIVFGRDGLYGYRLTGADIITYDYVFTAITASDDPTGHEQAALWTLWSLSWHDILTAALTAAGSIGKLLVDMLDAAISSRSTLSTSDVNTEVDTALSDINLDHLLAVACDSNTLANAVVDYSALAFLMAKGADISRFNSLLESLEAIADLLRASPTSASVTQEEQEIQIGVTYDETFSDLSISSDWTVMYFTVKADKDVDADSAAQVRIKKTNGGDSGDGLKVLGGDTAETASDGSLTVDQSAGTVRVVLATAATALLTKLRKGDFDIKEITTASGDNVVESGTMDISYTATRATS